MAFNYNLREVTTRAELDAVVDVVWVAQYNPYRPMFQTFFPVLGPMAQDRQQAIRESKDRLWEAHCSTDSSHWIFVEDTTSFEIVGGTQWQTIEDPSAHVGPLSKLEASWWPEGESRDFCSEVIRQVYAPQHQLLRGPYVSMLCMYNVLHVTMMLRT